MAEEDAVVAGVGAIDDADASQLAAMVGQVSDEQLAEGMADPKGRKLVLDEIFKRMAEHAEPNRSEGGGAVVHLAITGAPAGGADTYGAVIRGGEITVNNPPKE